MNPWKPVSLSVALCSMLSLASLSGTSLAEPVAVRAGVSSTEREPANTTTAASRTADSSVRDKGPRSFIDAS